MARTPDRPGSFRILKQGDGSYKLSGVRADGRRLKIPNLDKTDAEELARKMFPQSSSKPVIGPITDNEGDEPQIDDWGVPIRVGAGTVAALGQSFGVKSPEEKKKVEEKEAAKKAEADKKVERKKYADSLMGLAGTGYAAGTVWLGKKSCSWFNKEPVKANPKTVTDLAELAKTNFTDLLGDVELSPWVMMFLMTVGIPLAMVLQAPKKPQSPDGESKEPPELRSVK